MMIHCLREMRIIFDQDCWKGTKMSPKSKRELIEPHAGDKRYVRRKANGTFGKTVDVGRSLAADKRTKAETKVPKGQGDRGDTKQ
jgi:hypothetical protein